MSEIQPGFYLATYIDGRRRRVAIVVRSKRIWGDRKLALVPINGSPVITEGNWHKAISILTPMHVQGGLSGAMYWDHENAINLQGTAT